MNDKVVFLDITNKCNLRCKHCYNSRYFFSDSNVEFCYKTFIQKVEQYNISRIHILGGEPLLAKDLYEVLDYAKNKNITVSINTNGWFLNGNLFTKLSNYKNIDQITISIDGGIEEENDAIRGIGTFKKVIKNLKECNRISSHIRINIATVITKNNIENIDKIINLDVKYDCLMISLLFNEGQARLNFNDSFDYALFFRKISILIDNLSLKNIMVQLDLKPIGYWWLMIMLHRKLENDYYSEDCINEKLYYSANNKLYICNPSSFYKDKYEIKDNKTIEIRKFRCKKDCFFNSICFLCEINCETEKYNICDYVLNEIENNFKKIIHKKILIDSKYMFMNFNGNSVFVNFMSGAKYIISSEKCGDLYDISNVYNQCDKIEKRKYRTIITGLYVSGQIGVEL